MTDFVRDRNRALLSYDKKQIEEYCKKYHIDMPENEEVFWAGVHKSICNLFLAEDSEVSLQQYNKSYDWLIEHGFSPIIKDDGGDL